MKREDWQKAYEPLPEALACRVSSTLARLDKEEMPVRRISLRTAVIALAIVLALGGVAYAVIASQTADLFGWFYGEETKERLLAGDIAPSGESTVLGDVIYTLDDVIYKDGMIYGTGTIRPKEGANIVLIPEDYSVNEPAGYVLHYGSEEIPEDAPSYAELAAQRNAKIILAKCVANGVLNEDGSLNASEIGYTQMARQDGSIRFSLEFEGGAVQEGVLKAQGIDRQESYRLSLRIANWEVTPEGDWLREDPENTWLKTDWTVTVTPAQKGE
ncbi:MAG: hypothetical protein VB099_13990 [Candidatus Limiplasma sp.]|nr:hypothetical protein [Candidatus Limiplasma sp.]